METQLGLRQEQVTRRQELLRAGPQVLKQTSQAASTKRRKQSSGTYGSEEKRQRDVYYNPKTDGKQDELHWLAPKGWQTYITFWTWARFRTAGPQT
eukprot:161832-Heterocapsa_arctica.AAC.1